MEVIGREAELATLTRFLDAAGDGFQAALVEGEAGIGKSTLWRATVEDARARDVTVLTAVAAGTETQLAFTGLRDLLGGAFDAVADRLPRPQRHALAVTLLREESHATPPELGTIGVAVQTSLGLLAAERPVLVAVDDVQWLDESSAAALAYAARRLEGTRVSVLLAMRAGEASGRAVDALDDALVRITPGGLSVGALGRILRDELGVTFPRPTLHRLRDATGGNPFFALELARSLQRSQREPAPGEPLPVPERLLTLVMERLDELSDDATDLLACAARTSRPTVGLLGAVLGSSPDRTLDELVGAGLLDVRGDAIEFTHPLYAACVDELTTTRRAHVHGLLAAHATDAEERAQHVARATDTPNAETASAVAEGARTAYTRGSPAAAADLIASARRLTPRGDPEEAARALEEVEYRFAAGDTDAASSLLDDLLERTSPGGDRARLLYRKARIQHFGADIERSVALLHDALAETGAEDAALRGEIEEGLAWGLLLLRRDLESAAAHAASAARIAAAAGDDAALAEGLAAEALAAFVLGREWSGTMARAVELEGALAGTRVLRRPSFALGYCLSCADELDRARATFTALLDEAGVSGDESSIPSLLNHLTLIETLGGNWHEAERLADDGFERAVESGHRPTQASILAKRALVAARRGSLATARDLASQALGETDPTLPEAAMARGGETAMWTLGVVELWSGDAEGAAQILAPLTLALLDAGVAEPGEARCLPDAVEALTRTGERARAEHLVSALESWASRVGRASTTAAARRCRGLLLAADGDHGSALGALEQARDAAPSSLPFERARAFLALGSLERRCRRRRAARESLTEALAGFEALGALGQAEAARAELARIGGRAPSGDGLTPTEQRVADLVAEGRSNKEVATELVVSVHTVEAALTAIYRKLGVRSRTELARRHAVKE